MKKFTLVLISIGILICAILVVATNREEKLPACKSAPVQENTIDVYGVKYEWIPPYPLGI